MIFHDDWIETLNTLTQEISSRFLNYMRLMQIWQKKSLKKSKTNFFDTRQPKTNDDQY